MSRIKIMQVSESPPILLSEIKNTQNEPICSEANLAENVFPQNEPISPSCAGPCVCSAGSCTPEADVTLRQMSTSATHDPQQGVGRGRPIPPANVAHEDAHHRAPFDCAQGDVGAFGVTQCSYGKYNVNVAPWPSSEVTLSVPLWAERIRSTTANPRPVPVSLLV